ncbi:hypothetical protein GOP47_0022609 [Adiantum capillus-veneris]|uniref:DNA topoisomerase (ATP-hydrolyzing) n=1 Tax=Adiantum capillus-veneris TaxID=13818 RepID=A0A9D4U6L6_ADICA|nr:hypothetical protein GOP47_0022609 [Adiantum capillus-veneris]
MIAHHTPSRQLPRRHFSEDRQAAAGWRCRLHVALTHFTFKSRGKLPSVSLAKYQLCTAFSKDFRCIVFEKSEIQENLCLQQSGSAHRLVVMLRVLGIIQQLLEQGKHASKRDIYYTDPAIFHDVKMIDQAINDICIHFNCNRGSLNVVSVSKGYMCAWILIKFYIQPIPHAHTEFFFSLVMGWLNYNDDGRRIDCMKYSCTGLPIPVHTNLVQNIRSLADYILLVEKETVFQRLANDGYCLKNRCIIISGKGYPDVATRSFLRLLKDKLGLPVFGLVDGDPHGLDILLTYTFGSLSMAYDAEALVTPSIHWLGILLSDCEVFGVPARCLLPLSARDKQKATAILKRPYVKQYVPSWSNQIEMMLQQAVKLEIEAIASQQGPRAYWRIDDRFEEHSKEENEEIDFKELQSSYSFIKNWIDEINEGVLIPRCERREMPFVRLEA